MDEFKHCPRGISLPGLCVETRLSYWSPIDSLCAYWLSAESSVMHFFLIFIFYIDFRVLSQKKKCFLLLIPLLKESEFRGSRFTIQRFLLKSIDYKTFFFIIIIILFY